MPYLRMYSQHLPIEQKRVIAQKLIEITLRSFHLRPEDRNRITIQFISQPQVSEGDPLPPVIPPDGNVMLEVLGHDLTEEKKSAFTEEAAAMLADVVPPKPTSLIARLLRAKADTRRLIALQFHELSLGVGDPFVGEPQRRAA
jgi:hypothetical protein